MKAIAFILSLGCLLAHGQKLPPPPPMSVLNKPVKVLRPTVKPLPLKPLPSSWGVSYTNQLSLIPTQRWTSGWGRLNPVYIPHDYRHDPLTGAWSAGFQSEPGRLYDIEQTASGIFYPLETVGGWFGTNRTVVTNIWPEAFTRSNYIRIVRR